MRQAQPTPGQGPPPETFVEQVKQTLEHLFDFPYLQAHPLAFARGSGGMPDEASGQRLRREVIAAIEVLSPNPGTGFRAPHARLYNLLHLHYIEDMTVQEAANELGISLRQAYRDLRRGEESVAATLWEHAAPELSQDPRASQLSSIQAEMDRLETHPRSLDVHWLLQRAQKAVDRLALQHQVAFEVESASGQATVATDPVAAQQIVVNVLSHVVQQARQPGIVHMGLIADAVAASLVLRYVPNPSADITVIGDVAMQLLDRLGWTLHIADQPGGMRTITLNLAASGPTVLVVDDNEGLVELLERYLGGHACRVVAARNGREGIRLAQELLPDAILLDVMMPEVDGWEVLQTLRMNPQTAAIPVIVCSVFNDPDLAFSLGASLVLSKPFRREDVLASLRQLGVV